MLILVPRARDLSGTRMTSCPFSIGTTHTCAHYTLLSDLRTENLFSLLQESPEPLEVERSTGLFDTDSELFKENLMILAIMLGCGILGGTVWEVLFRLRQKMKIRPQGNSAITTLLQYKTKSTIVLRRVNVSNTMC